MAYEENEINKDEFIQRLTELLGSDDVVIRTVSVSNDSEELSRVGSRIIEDTLTGYSTIQIDILNTKKHEAFTKKLRCMY